MNNPHAAPPASVWPWVLLLAGLVGMYFSGLDSAYVPTNGDELVYVHIARATAQTGHWLPLASELDNMRNTKPPLLFWQAMVAGDWGRHWSLAALRLPSVIYTLLTAMLVALLTRRISGSVRQACIAAALYLLFFSTFRYCRAYLTSAPETFWFGLPLFAFLWIATRPAGAPPRAAPFWLYLVSGMCFGIGALYKSFALIAPACASLWGAALMAAPQPRRQALITSTLGAALSGAIALAVFALWFWLDPDPASVWQEFVLGENTRKMDSALPYWQAALWGDDPVYKQLWAYPENAATLGLIVVGGMVSAAKLGWQGRTAQTTLPAALHLLWVWPLVWLLVFAIPSQRDARYLIPAMPAVAIALALLWDRISRGWFVATALVLVPAIALLARIAWVLGHSDIGSPLLLWTTMLLALGSLALALLVVLFPRYSRMGALWVCAGLYACFLFMAAPLDQPGAQFNAETQASLAGKRVAVPNGFTGQFERFRFVLPGADLVPYDALGRNTGVLEPTMPGPQRLEFLLRQFDAVVWIVESDAQPECLPGCRVLDQRWFVKSRHKAGEVRLDNIADPRQWLLGREYVVAPSP
jgi:4-amino-4-deoxy-L-arabinose transferase-like glycosyltransferase